MFFRDARLSGRMGMKVFDRIMGTLPGKFTVETATQARGQIYYDGDSASSK